MCSVGAISRMKWPPNPVLKCCLVFPGARLHWFSRGIDEWHTGSFRPRYGAAGCEYYRRHLHVFISRQNVTRDSQELVGMVSVYTKPVSGWLGRTLYWES